jgi:hypothetical protein
VLAGEKFSNGDACDASADDDDISLALLSRLSYRLLNYGIFFMP